MKNKNKRGKNRTKEIEDKNQKERKKGRIRKTTQYEV